MGGRNTWIKNPKPLGSWAGHCSVPFTYTHTPFLLGTVIYSFNSPARRWKRILLSEKPCMGSFDHSVGLDCCMALFRHWCERRACNCQSSCTEAWVILSCFPVAFQLSLLMQQVPKMQLCCHANELFISHLILCIHAQTYVDVLHSSFMCTHVKVFIVPTCTQGKLCV